MARKKKPKWFVAPYANNYWCVRRSNDSELVCLLEADGTKANADIIANAPEMLDMLDELLGACELNLDEMEPETIEVRERANALVCRIRGIVT